MWEQEYLLILKKQRTGSAGLICDSQPRTRQTM